MDLEKLKKVPFLKATQCSVCEQTLNQPIFSFPNFPLTEIYLPERNNERIGFLDLHFHLCRHCGQGQLSNHISPEVLYESSYYFRTSSSATASQANDIFLSFINSIIGEKKIRQVIEMGCSDLYLLRALKPRAELLLGVDPVLKGKEQQLNDDKIKVRGDLFENLNFNEYDLTETIVLSSHTLEHIQSPKPLLRDLLDHATPSTIFFFQFPGFEALVEHCRFDQIFHQHLQYFSLHSFKYLVEELGGEIISSKVNYQHWGSLLLAFRKKQNNDSDNKSNNPYDNKNASEKSFPTASKITEELVLRKYALFQQQMNIVGSSIRDMKNERLVGYGAALMLPVLGYHLHINFSNFDLIADDDPQKQSLYYANLPVPIKSAAEIGDTSSTTVVITAIDNSRQILPKALALHPKRIIIPFSSI